ncbi:MAG: PHB depolymerase family esterase, partial [Bacteroidales bacterium]
MIHNDLERTYILHIPPGHDKSAQVPLVLALHGRGTTAEGMVLITRKGFNKLADRDGFLLVYPNGIE